VKKEKGLIPFGQIKLPRRYESEHIFIGGKPRVGKSVMAKQQIHSIRQAGHRAAIGDFKGEYTELFTILRLIISSTRSTLAARIGSCFRR